MAEHHAWFSLYSNDPSTRAILADRRAKLGGRISDSARAFGIQSDDAISRSHPLTEHVDWLLGKIERDGTIMDAIQHPATERAEVFLYVQTSDHGAYVDLDPFSLRRLTNLGLSLRIKIEFYDEPNDL